MVAELGVAPAGFLPLPDVRGAAGGGGGGGGAEVDVRSGGGGGVKSEIMVRKREGRRKAPARVMRFAEGMPPAWQCQERNWSSFEGSTRIARSTSMSR